MNPAELSNSSTVGGRLARRLIIVLVVGVFGLGLWYVIGALGTDPVEDIHSDYGRRRGIDADDSVNGTNVLAEMFEKRDHKVITWRKLSPKLNKMDTIVWFPDDMDPPTKEHREWLEKWLSEGYNRTLVYVGRDYDAEITYWNKVLPNAPQEEQSKIKARLDLAKKRHDEMRGLITTDEEADWFVVRDRLTRRKVNQLNGRWVRESGVDETKTWIEYQGFLDEPESAYYDPEVLLESSQGDPLVMRISAPYSYEWGNGKIIVVANGSFLLNLPLVNHEHRKLASLLIDECQYGDSVAFVESGIGATLKIRESDFESQNQAWYTLLTVWPLNAVILHIAAAGIVICFAMFPIFGRPHTIAANDASDFGKHIDALGKLLAKTQDSAYAQARLAYYDEKIKRDSGASHAE